MVVVIAILVIHVVVFVVVVVVKVADRVSHTNLPFMYAEAAFVSVSC